MSSGPVVRGLRHQLVDLLRNDVLSGYYEEGQPIRQDDVVSRYNVSRTPVREALIQLAEEGLVTTAPNRGARVAEQAPDAVREFLTPIRRIIEVYALKLRFSQSSDEGFGELDAVLEKMRAACAAKDYAGVAEQDIAFHRAIVEMSGEPSLLKIWTTLIGQVRAHFRQSLLEYDDLMDVYHEHAAIRGALRDGDHESSIEFYSNLIGNPDAEMKFENYLLAKRSRSRQKGSK